VVKLFYLLYILFTSDNQYALGMTYFDKRYSNSNYNHNNNSNNNDNNNFIIITKLWKMIS
jgi:hypothetical protein